MPRTRSPFRPSARPDCNDPAFPPPVLPIPPTMSSADCHQPFGHPCGRPTREPTSIFVSPLFPAGSHATRDRRAQAKHLVSRCALRPAFNRENQRLSRGTPRLLSTRSRRIYVMRRVPMARTSDCVAPSSPCIPPLFGFCTSARVFASGFLHPALTEPNSAIRYPSHHPARG